VLQDFARVRVLMALNPTPWTQSPATVGARLRPGSTGRVSPVRSSTPRSGEGGSRPSTGPKVGDDKRSDRLRALLQQAQVAANAAQRKCSTAQEQAVRFTDSLEDARVAIMGYQVDIERERARHSKLEADVAALRQEAAQLRAREQEVTDMNSRLAAEVDTLTSREPELAQAVEALRAQLAEAKVEAGSPSGQLARLADTVSIAEANCETEEFKVRELMREEAALEARHRELQAMIKAVSIHRAAQRSPGFGGASRMQVRQLSAADAAADAAAGFATTCLVQDANGEAGNTAANLSRISEVPTEQSRA